LARGDGDAEIAVRGIDRDDREGRDRRRLEDRPVAGLERRGRKGEQADRERRLHRSPRGGWVRSGKDIAEWGWKRWASPRATRRTGEPPLNAAAIAHSVRGE